ncbi:MAG TPA: IS30 family transposase [Lachnospira sp.]|nr:IS30 family transposase [Lachnospira sp.]
MKGWKQLKYSDRIRIEAWLRAKISVQEIADMLHVHRSTIYREIKRGQYEHLNSDYTVEKRYSPEIAQKHCDENLQVRGTQLKIGNDYKYAEYIEKKIIEENYSPEAVLGELRVQNRAKDFSVSICIRTLYNYIDKGVFLNLTNKNLPVKRNKKRGYKKVRVQKRASVGTSIEERPEYIRDRKEFGHWEMDSVVGKRGKSKNTFLVLTERKTRNEIIFKLPDHSATEVVKAVDRLEITWGSMFSDVFKTITVDNGTEFSYFNELERSCTKPDEKRTKVYYCHPYSSWERGSNENNNKMVRRIVPKGTNFDSMTDDEVLDMQIWINGYPRRIHDYHSAAELFEKEIAKLVS